MKLLCAVSVTVRLAGMAFLAGFLVGVALCYRAVDGPAEPSRAPATSASLSA